ncbi:MAG: hypothetical protein U9P12_04980, partial [Verrucomicrobiota bacterium]|nr:hypothetical protein [Verrucomicrobiota bacterium]
MPSMVFPRAPVFGNYREIKRFQWLERNMLNWRQLIVSIKIKFKGYGSMNRNTALKLGIAA